MTSNGAIRIEVLGVPAPKGSSRAIMRGGFATNVPSGSDANKRALVDWGSAVRHAALEAVGERTEPVFLDAPLVLTITFWMPRPKGHWGKTGLRPSAPPYPHKKPDSSKLLRSTEDALIGLVFDDDSRIVDQHVGKRWAQPGRCGATITVERAT